MAGISSKLRIVLLTAAVLALGSGTALAGWIFTDLSLQGDITDVSFASSINDNGDIVGRAHFAGLDTYEYHATLWSGGVAYDLWSGSDQSRANSINDAGVIVGQSFVTTFPTGFKAAIFSTSADAQIIHPYDIPYSLSSYSGIGDINNSGQMVGTVGTDYRDQIPVIWQDATTYTILDAGPVNVGGALKINNLGQVTGRIGVATENGFYYGAAFWDVDGTLTSFGSLDGRFSFTHGLNDLGQVLIVVDNGNVEERWSYVWQDGELSERLPDLGGGYTEAYAINNAGMIVGKATTADGTDHAVLWQDGEIIDLNELVAGTGMILESAVDINEKGQIIGYGIKEEDGIYSNNRYAFLLTPDLTPTPVPASLLLFGSGLAGLGLLRRRRQA